MPEWEAVVRQHLDPSNIDGARESEIVAEIAQYLQDCYDDVLATGVSEAEARGIALERLGQGATLLEELRRLQQPIAIEPPPSGGFMSSLIYDSKFALRSIRRKPAFSLMVLGMLALGIAGNAAIFSIFNALFLKPLPFAHGDRLVDLDETAPKWDLHYVGVSNQDLFGWRHYNTTFDGVAFFKQRSYNLSGMGAAQRIKGVEVTRDMLNVLGLQPALGRNFSDAEDKPGGAKVVLLGYGLWKSRFHGDREVLGRIIKLSEQPYTITGVLPAEAVFPDEAELWVPLAADPNQQRGWYLAGLGRLKSEVSIERAQADLLRIHHFIPETFKGANSITSPLITPLRERYLGDFRTVSKVLMAGVVVVLLIACFNIGALMMVRAASRTHEIAVRTAMGAGRGRIVRQLLTENLMLAAMGGVAGILLGRLALQGLLAMLPDVIPHWVGFDLDIRFAAFSLLLTGGATLLFGLVPAIRTANADTRGSLHESGSRLSLTRGNQRVLGGLVVFEVGLALTLLIAAALLAEAFRNVLHVDPGFRAENVLTFSVSLPGTDYAHPEKILAFHRTLLDELRHLPGVQSAGAASDAPLGGHSGYFFESEDGRKRGPNEANPVVLQVMATPGYIEAVGMTLLAGRIFDERDGTSKDAPVAIVNETFAKYHWPGKNPVGRRIRHQGSTVPWMLVIGELRDERHYGLDQDVKPGVFLPEPQNPVPTMTVILRAASNPEALATPAREVLHRINPDLPMFEVRTMTEQVDRSVWARRTYSWLFGSFAFIALLLAALGLYGVIAWVVAQRTREIGIRMALGAHPLRLLAQVLRSGMLLIGIGTALGIAGAFAATRLLGTLLFGVNPRDPWLYISVSAAVACVGAVANLVPARRAAAVDPMKALRTE